MSCETAQHNGMTGLVILSLNDDGNVPPGIHLASWEEVEERFGRNSYRQKLPVLESGRKNGSIRRIATLSQSDAFNFLLCSDEWAAKIGLKSDELLRQDSLQN